MYIYSENLVIETLYRFIITAQMPFRCNEKKETLSKVLLISQRQLIG